MYYIISGAEMIDLNAPDPDEEFQEAVLEDGLIYTKVKVHKSLFETNCLVSAAKLKCHSSAGISLSLKNFIGLLPVSIYRLSGTSARAEYVHAPDPITQIPYNIIDLARLFPIDFAFIDGIRAIDKGEGPWVNGISFVQPGLLVASVEAIAADTICCQGMSIDPKALYPTSPFVNCYNHLTMATEYGLGSKNLEDIQVLGNDIDDAVYPYHYRIRKLQLKSS